MILRTSAALIRRLSELLEPFGITLQQYNVLRILRGAHEPLPTMTIGQRMIEETPGITRLLDRLESKGLVTRARHRDDRRQVLCTITDPGLELLRQLDEPVQQFNDRSTSALPVNELRLLTSLLDQIRKDIIA